MNIKYRCFECPEMFDYADRFCVHMGAEHYDTRTYKKHEKESLVLFKCPFCKEVMDAERAFGMDSVEREHLSVCAVYLSRCLVRGMYA